MSWSFSVKEKDGDNAMREFGNALFDNNVHLPSDIGENLMVAAKAFVEKVPAGCDVHLSSSGHVDADGIGYGVVRFEFTKRAEVPPHLENK